jgi:hypothetical protein
MTKRSLLLFTSGWLVAAAVLAGAAAAQETAPEAATGPRAVLVEPVIDLGDVTYGTSRTHDFVVRNEGTEPLRLHDARSNCVCTVVEHTQEIPPQGEGKVSIRFNAEIQGSAAAVSVDALTNDPENPKLTFSVKANVKYFIDAKPGYARYLVVQDFEGDSTVAQTLWAVDGKPIQITAVESPYPFIQASFREARPDELDPDAPTKQQWKVETRISPDAPVGALTGDLTVHVNHPEQKVLKLPVHGFVRPMIAVTPPVADCGKVTPGEHGMRTSLYVKSFAAEEVKVTGAETSVEGISANVVEETPGRVYYVVLYFPPEMPKGEFSGVVRIKTASAKKPVVEVPLKGTVL